MLWLSFLVNFLANFNFCYVLQETDEGGINVLERVVGVVLNLLNTVEVSSQNPLLVDAQVLFC